WERFRQHGITARLPILERRPDLHIRLDSDAFERTPVREIVPFGADPDAHSVAEVEVIRLAGTSIGHFTHEHAAATGLEWLDEIFAGGIAEAVHKKEYLTFVSVRRRWMDRAGRQDLSVSEFLVRVEIARHARGE